MRVWIDLANSPHVALLQPLARRLEADGDEVLVTVRDHAQTRDLAQTRFQRLTVIGGASPPGRRSKARAIAARAEALRRFAAARRPDVAFSHGSYAQLLAARAAGVPAATMMDYEHQPANHLSFRLASRVIVPEAFPASALRRCGARAGRVIRYPGFKEQLYLASFTPDPSVLATLELDPARVIAVFRPPPEGALYHRMANDRFDGLLEDAAAASGVQSVVLARTAEQRRRYRSLVPEATIPINAVDAGSLLALADVAIGAGGTMNRESAILGTPTYTVFAGRLAAVDAELIRLGRMQDLRAPGVQPSFVKKRSRDQPDAGAAAAAILETMVTTLIALR